MQYDNGLPITILPAPLNWKDNLAKKWWQRKIADEALQVEKDRRRQLVVERLIKKTQDGTLNQPTDDPWPEESSGEEMGVRVGDETNVHYHMPTPQRNGVAGKVALGAALLVGGVGLGAVVPLALSWLNRPQAPTVVAGDDDTDTAYTVEIGKEPVE